MKCTWRLGQATSRQTLNKRDWWRNEDLVTAAYLLSCTSSGGKVEKPCSEVLLWDKQVPVIVIGWDSVRLNCEHARAVPNVSATSKDTFINRKTGPQNLGSWVCVPIHYNVAL